MNRKWLLKKFALGAAICLLGPAAAVMAQSDTGPSVEQDPSVDENATLDVADPGELQEDYVEEGPTLESPAQSTGQGFGQVEGQTGDERNLAPMEVPQHDVYGQYDESGEPQVVDPQAQEQEQQEGGPFAAQPGEGEEQDGIAQGETEGEDWMQPPYEDEQLTEDIQQPIPSE